MLLSAGPAELPVTKCTGEGATFSDLPVKLLVSSFPNLRQLKQSKLELSGIILTGTALANGSR